MALRRGGDRKKLTSLLRWEYQWGGIAKKWEERYAQTGHEPPDEYHKRPVPDAEELILYAAFYDLSSERQMGTTMGPIPRSIIRAFATEEMGLAADDHDRFCAIIQRMDGEYLLMTRPKSDDGKGVRDRASVKDPAGQRRILKNLGRNPKPKPPNG